MLPSCPPCPGLARSPAAHGQRAHPLPLPQVPAHPSLIPALSRFLSGGGCICVVRPERPQQQGMTSVGRGRSRTGTGRGSPELTISKICSRSAFYASPPRSVLPPLLVSVSFHILSTYRSYERCLLDTLDLPTAHPSLEASSISGQDGPP